MRTLQLSLSMLAAFAAPIAAGASAGPIKSPAETNALCAAVAQKMGNGETDAAFELLAPNWPLPTAELSQLAYQTKSKLEMVSARFGTPIGAEFIKTVSAGQSFVRHLYVIKFEKHALRLSCTFYKPKDAWIVNGVSWDDSTDKLFE